MELKTKKILLGIAVISSYPFAIALDTQAKLENTESNLMELHRSIDDMEVKLKILTNNNKNLESEIDELEKIIADYKAKEGEPSQAKAYTRTPQQSTNGKTNVNIVATFYTSLAEENGGWAGMNAIGGQLKQGSLAVPKDIPLGSNFYIEGYGNFVADDRGGAIKRIDSNTIKVDIYVPRKSGESDSTYKQRVNNMGVVKTTGWYTLP